MPYRGHHVLADPESCDGIVRRENGPVFFIAFGFPNGIEGFFKPPVSEGKRLVSR